MFMVNTMQLEMMKCPRCSEVKLPVKRKELGYHVCIDCSTAKPVVGITTVEGSGDHTYNDIIIMDQDRARSIATKEAELKGQKVNIEMLDLDTDEAAISQSVKERVNNVLEEDDNDTIIFDVDETPQGIEGIDY
tara:strand:- start:236 stop:637 length:402 start_codon:yes stop_codon:yes gene_type:complete